VALRLQLGAALVATGPARAQRWAPARAAPWRLAAAAPTACDGPAACDGPRRWPRNAARVTSAAAALLFPRPSLAIGVGRVAKKTLEALEAARVAIPRGTFRDRICDDHVRNLNGLLKARELQVWRGVKYIGLGLILVGLLATIWTKVFSRQDSREAEDMVIFGERRSPRTVIKQVEGDDDEDDEEEEDDDDE
ncbi:hypothetical protein M885DRAFT_580921, partial [Pelagophyceae sp. CCMP2097]